jgi:hypothetical protein
MSSITDVVKEGLKYPFNDGKKVLTLGIILVVSSLVSIFMEYMVFDNMRTLANAAPIDTVQAAISALPPSSVALVVLSWIVSLIFALFCAGYLYNVIKYSIEKRSDLPGFSDIKGIFVNGIKTVIVEIAYMILPFILFLLGLMLTVNEAVSSSVNTIGGILVVIAMIFLIFAALVEIMAICNMVAKDDLKAAFDFKGILAQIKSIGWGRFLGIIIFTGVVIAIISIFFEMIFGAIATGLSILFGSALVLVLTKAILDSLLVNPYVSIVLSRVYGSIYREANSLE